MPTVITPKRKAELDPSFRIVAVWLPSGDFSVLHTRHTSLQRCAPHFVAVQCNDYRTLAHSCHRCNLVQKAMRRGEWSRTAASKFRAVFL